MASTEEPVGRTFRGEGVELKLVIVEARSEGGSPLSSSERVGPQCPRGELPSTIEGHLLSLPSISPTKRVMGVIEDVGSTTWPSLKKSPMEAIPLFAQS